MVHYSHFHTLDPSAHHVSMDLLNRAEREPPSMICFMLRWMGFNGWLAAVTGCERDYQMINSLAVEPRMIAAYDRLIATDPDFKTEVEAFAAHWPVLNVAHVRAVLGYDAFRCQDRATLLAACDAQGVKRQPAHWMPGTMPSWSSCCARSTKSAVTCFMARSPSRPPATATWFSPLIGSSAN